VIRKECIEYESERVANEVCVGWVMWEDFFVRRRSNLLLGLFANASVVSESVCG